MENNDYVNIQNLIAQGDREIKAESANGILFIGATSSGKTTLLCLLAQKRLKGFTNNTGRKCIDLVDQNEPMKIGHYYTSCTTIPNSWRDRSVTYYDCPGFEDNKSVSQEIANAYYVKKIGNSHQQLKFVLVIPYGSEDQARGNSIAELLTQVNSLVPDTSRLFEGLSIVLTKCPKNYRVQHFINFLEKAIKENNRFKHVEKLTMMMIRNPQKFCIFKKPSENCTIDLSDRERILACIEQSRFVEIKVQQHLGTKPD